MDRQIPSSWDAAKHEPSKRTDVRNRIRALLETDLKIPTDLQQPLINLGLGEPSKANGFDLPPVIVEAMEEVLKGEKSNGYTMASGTIEARKAIVEKFSTPEHPFTEREVILTFGCSGGLFNAIAVLCEPGDNIIVAKPGFPLCQPICENLGVEYKFYDLVPERQWEVDLESLKKQITPKTRAILVNNPSNPCGSCYSVAHQLEILEVANSYRVPIIADEVYYGLSFDDTRPFNSFGNLTSEVPIICCSAISKIYCLPGWRLGWLIVYNNNNYFDKVIENLHKHNMIQLHPCSLVQAALPKILKEVGDDHFDTLKKKLKTTADYAFERLSQIRGITPIKSSAAMYMMIKINIDELADIEDDLDFAKKLLHEQACLVFPSQCFFEKNFFRIIICTKTETIEEFAKRLEVFFQLHLKK